MARPERHDADYFPFFVKDGKTLYILESKYGLEGIGFFTNLMRFLTKQPDHHICIADETDRLYFFAQIHCPVDKGMDMLDTMTKTGKIDGDLWITYRVIVSPDLLKSLEAAYLKRKNKIISVDSIRLLYTGNEVNGGIKESETPIKHEIQSHNTQRIVKDRIVKDSSIKEFPVSETPQPSKPALLEKDQNEEKEPGTLMMELREVTEEIGTLMPDAIKHRQMMVFVEANIRGSNHNAILHCLKSMRDQLKKGEQIEKPRAYLDAALKIENGKHNAREHEQRSNQFKVSMPNMSSIGDIFRKAAQVTT